MTVESSCPFCSIAQGDVAGVEVVCRGESWVAFFPLGPATPGHTLIVPNDHVSDLWQADADTSRDLMDAARRVGGAIDEALHPDGLNLITSAREAAEQTIFHLHLHIVPRWRQDDFGPIWVPEDGVEYPEGRLAEVADQIRAACEFGEAS